MSSVDVMTILIADSRVTAIPVFDIGEPLVDLQHLVRAVTGPGRLARSSLAVRLHLADEALPDGMRLRVVEGYRTAEDQQAIVDEYSERVRADRPGIDDGTLRQLTSRHVAPLESAPHVAGAAVDLTLVDARGQELWMGSALDATPEESQGACYTDATWLDPEAIVRRRILVSTLHAAGLVNYPTEWWHWSFGDRYWAHVTGARQALYGPVEMSATA